jgi:hypothetical protein
VVGWVEFGVWFGLVWLLWVGVCNGGSVAVLW